MEWLNYHHLLYFWTVVREGTVAAAARRLHLSQPTVSSQVRALEEALGEPLFVRSGRTLVLTETGRVVHRYADEIFSLGRELLDTVRGRPVAGPLRMSVGVVDVVPKLMTHRLLAPALEMEERVRVTCYEGKLSELLARLALHELDLVLSDAPMGPETKIRAYHHALGDCPVSVMAARSLAGTHRRRFPRSLDGAPMLLPTPNTAVRRDLDRWMEENDLRPHVVGEFEDSALLKVFGQEGRGLFFVPSIIEREVARQYGVRRVGRIEEVQERFYAISPERRIKHPGVAAITEAAREGFAA